MFSFLKRKNNNVHEFTIYERSLDGIEILSRKVKAVYGKKDIDKTDIEKVAKQISRYALLTGRVYVLKMDGKTICKMVANPVLKEMSIYSDKLIMSVKI